MSNSDEAPKMDKTLRRYLWLSAVPIFIGLALTIFVWGLTGYFFSQLLTYVSPIYLAILGGCFSAKGVKSVYCIAAYAISSILIIAFAHTGMFERDHFSYSGAVAVVGFLILLVAAYFNGPERIKQPQRKKESQITEVDKHEGDDGE